MIMATIKAECEADLQNMLASINSAPGFANPNNSVIPFAHFSRLHVARFVIIRANTNNDIISHGRKPDDWQPKLAFLGDIDGDLNTCLGELVLRAGVGLDKIFRHCVEYDAAPPTLLAWLKAHNKSSTANYQNWRGRTVLQVHQEQALTAALQDKLADMEMSDSNSLLTNGKERLLYRQLQAHVKQATDKLHLRLDPPAATPTRWWLVNVCNLITLPLILLALSPILLLAVPFYLLILRRLENADPENMLRPNQDHLQELTNQEDIDVSNHFNVFGQVKPGLFRGLTIRVLLWVLDYASRHVYHCGFLARIQTIHFARWVLLDNNKRVYFASNYDGSADSYMDDFINKVAWGLNLVFSNGVGYPKTRFLIKGGAENEAKYKKTLRRNQLPSESWYKAYPGLNAIDLARNSRIRQGLEKSKPSGREIRQWLMLLKRKEPVRMARTFKVQKGHRV
jgi:hypothetical protein